MMASVPPSRFALSTALLLRILLRARLIGMTTTQPSHHLNIEDYERAVVRVDSTGVDLRCHEGDCFVEGSELLTLLSKPLPVTSVFAHEARPSTRRSR